MKKISSRWTYFYKRVFPVLWFGIIAVVLIAAIASGAAHKAPPALIVPVVMAVAGYFVMKYLVWDLADEVFDCGDFLLVRNGHDEDRVFLSNVMNVAPSVMINPPRIVLRLVTPGRWGSEIVFSPEKPFTLNPLARIPVAEDLIVRVDRARRR